MTSAAYSSEPCLHVQVQELLQHRTGSNALAQQSDAGRNAVEVMGLQKVYPAKKGRSACLPTFFDAQTCDESQQVYCTLPFMVHSHLLCDYMQYVILTTCIILQLAGKGQKARPARPKGLLGHQGLLVCH